jgi:hypothetical protein
MTAGGMLGAEWWEDDSEAMKLKIAEWLEGVETPRVPLTKWEIEFVSSVERQFAERGSLSPKQVVILQRIYEEKA